MTLRCAVFTARRLPAILFSRRFPDPPALPAELSNDPGHAVSKR